MRVREVMSSPAVVVAPETSVKQAAALLDERGFTCLPAVDGDGKLAGAVSDADLLMNRFPPDPHIPVVERPEREVGATISDVMTVDVLTVTPDNEVSVVLAALNAAGRRSVPVVDASTVVGIVTYRDLVHALARDDTLIAADVQRRLDLYSGAARWEVGVQGGDVALRTNTRTRSTAALPCGSPSRCSASRRAASSTDRQDGGRRAVSAGGSRRVRDAPVGEGRTSGSDRRAGRPSPLPVLALAHLGGVHGRFGAP